MSAELVTNWHVSFTWHNITTDWPCQVVNDAFIFTRSDPTTTKTFIVSNIGRKKLPLLHVNLAEATLKIFASRDLVILPSGDFGSALRSMILSHNN